MRSAFGVAPGPWQAVDMSWYQRTMRRFGRTRLFAAIMPTLAPPADRLAHRLSGGRVVLAQIFLPTLVLTATGRRSGQLRQTPVAYVRDGDRFALAATNFGKAQHPAWSANLLTNPRAAVVVDGVEQMVVARLAEPGERERLWDAFTAMWPAYDTYVERSGRTPRIFVLEPEA